MSVLVFSGSNERESAIKGGSVEPDLLELTRLVQSQGLLDRSPRRYVGTALFLILTGALIVGLLALQPFGWQLLVLVLLPFWTMQVGFVGHDAGHQQVFPKTGGNRWVGLVCMPLVLGISFTNWATKHNIHHAHTNEVGADPDIENPVLAYTPEAARSRRGIGKWIVRHQAILYFVLALGATLGFRLDAWRWVRANFRARAIARTEALFLLGNAVLTVAIPTVLLGPLTWLPLFVGTQALLGLYMANVFAPNHKGMPLLRPGEELGFFAQQVLTSRNVTGGWLVELLYGGLNYQIEHHLFPRMPRRNLRRCCAIVREYCRERGLPYTEETPGESFRILVRTLREVGQVAA